MEKQTVFRKVSVKDRLPIKTGKYLTNWGACIFSIHTNKWLFMLEDVTLLVDDWLEEIELPSEEDVKRESVKYYGNSPGERSINIFKHGANYILNKLK